MGHAYQIFPDLELGMIRLRGKVTADTAIEFLHKLYGDERWQPGFATLWDLRGIRELIILPPDLRRIPEHSAALTEERGTGKVAVVVGRRLDREVLTLFMLRRKTRLRQIEIFWSIQEALDWLGIDKAPADLLKAVGADTPSNHK